MCSCREISTHLSYFPSHLATSGGQVIYYRFTFTNLEKIDNIEPIHNRTHTKETFFLSMCPALFVDIWGPGADVGLIMLSRYFYWHLSSTNIGFIKSIKLATLYRKKSGMGAQLFIGKAITS